VVRACVGVGDASWVSPKHQTHHQPQTQPQKLKLNYYYIIIYLNIFIN